MNVQERALQDQGKNTKQSMKYRCERETSSGVQDSTGKRLKSRPGGSGASGEASTHERPEVSLSGERAVLEPP